MEELLFERRGSVAWVTFNRPEARNAMTFPMYERLSEVCSEVNADESVRVMVLTGAGGKAFVSGTDISQFLEFKEERHALEYEERMNSILETIETVKIPTIAAIQGTAVGGGAAIAAACDLRIGSPSTRVGFPIARTLGNCLSVSNTARLASLIGIAGVKELLFTARLIDAQEALSMGFLNEVTPDEDSLPARAAELASTIAGHAPLTLRATKEALRRIQRRTVPEDGKDLVLLCYMSRDFREGVDAFMNKRKPVWKGE